MSADSGTPRTDAAAIGFARLLVNKCSPDNPQFSVTEIIPANFARTLEREAAALRAELDADRDDDNMRSLYTANLEADNEKLRADRDALAEALRLPFLWEEAFNVSAASSDNVLDQHGWDGKSAPDEFMHEYARKALSQHGGKHG